MNLKNKAKEWLLWSQKYTKLDMLYIGKGGFWITVGQIFGVLLSFILALSFANWLPKEIYGQYKYVFSVIGVLSIFSLGGMRDAISRAVARGQEGVLKTAVSYQLRWGTIFTIVTNIAGAYYFIRGNKTLAIPLFIFAFIFPTIKAFGTYSAFIVGKKDFKTSTVYDLISSFINSSALIITLFLTDNLYILIGVYLLSDLASNIVLYFITLRKYKPTEEGKNDTEALQYGTQLTFLSALGILAQQLDKILIFKYSGAVELAMYSIASAIPDRLKGFGKSIISLSYPKLSEKNIPEIRSVFNLRIIQGMLLGTGISVAYMVSAPFLFKLLMPQYVDSIFFSQLLSLSLIVLFPHFFVGYAIQAQKMVRSIYVISISTAVIKSCLYIAFGFFWGAIGIVLARVVSFVLVFLLGLIMWHIETGDRNINKHSLTEKGGPNNI